MTLGRAASLIRERNLLDTATVDRLEAIAKLRNSVAHRGATYGVPSREGDTSRAEYRGRHVVTEPEGLRQLMDDLDSTTRILSDWLQKAGLGTASEWPRNNINIMLQRPAASRRSPSGR